MADMPAPFMRSTSVHDTRSLLKLLITVEGRSENSDDVPKGNPLTALVFAAYISSATLILYWPWHMSLKTAGIIEGHAAQRQSEEAAEGFASFLEKRPARWNRAHKPKI
jgi:hypothetical protein